MEKEKVQGFHKEGWLTLASLLCYSKGGKVNDSTWRALERGGGDTVGVSGERN